MNKLKDFFYDKNDLVVALLIIVLAGIVISWRVNVIMDYPEVLAAELEAQENGIQNGSSGTAGDDTVDEGASADTAADPGTSTDAAVTPPVQPPAGQTTGQTGQQTGQQPGSNVTITIPSGADSDSIAQILLDAGVISSKKDFLQAATAANADRKLKAGTFTIPAGSTIDQVVAIVTK